MPSSLPCRRPAGPAGRQTATFRQPPRSRPPSTTPHAISIDRRAHMDAAWRRQEAEEAALAALAASGPGGGGAGPGPGSMSSALLDPAAVHPLRSAAHLDAMATAAGGATVLAVVFYSRSCGTCKAWLAEARALAAEAGASRSGVLFASHDVRDAWDEPSDLARLHRVRAVPSILFFSGGASVKRLAAPDSRSIAPGEHAAMGGWVHARLRSVLAEVVFRETPSARRG